jgi:hypothetical protein
MTTNERNRHVSRVLVDGLAHRSTPQSEDELVQDLDRIDAAAAERGDPLIATLYADSDTDDPPSLSIALGAPDSLLVYTASRTTGEGAYSKSSPADNARELSFRYGSDYSFYESWMLIPKTAAYEAAKEFFRTGARPANVEWDEL